VASPTYLLVLEHPGRIPLRHADAYLPAKLEGFLAEGGADYLFDPASVVAIEWADRIAHLVPQDALWVRLAPDASGGEGRGPHPRPAGELPLVGRPAENPVGRRKVPGAVNPRPGVALVLVFPGSPARP
jgi:hypothetical protein